MAKPTPTRSWMRLHIASLLTALAISLIAHSTLFITPNGLFSFANQSNKNAQSLSIRMIEAPASMRLEVASDASPAGQLAAPPLPAASPPAPSPTEIAPPVRATTQATQAAALPAAQPEALPRTESSLSAATSATLTTATSEKTAAADNNTTPGAPAALKLQYPANAQLQFSALQQRRGQSQSGSGQLNWKSDGNAYELKLESSFFTQSSVGVIAPMGLTPERFSDRRSGRSERATHFRREIGKIQFSSNQPEVPLMAGAQDALSVSIQLAGILAGDPERYKIVNRIRMQVAGTESAEIWEFVIEGIQDISLPAANLQTLKLSRKPRDEFDQRLELWLVPQLLYLPARIRYSSASEPLTDFTELSLDQIPR